MNAKPVTFVGSRQDGAVLIERLKLWTERLVRVRIKKADYCCQLAEMGVITRVPPTIDSRDRPNVVRIKEKLLAVSSEREQIRREMASMGAEILDEQTLEVLFPGGPEPDSFLSWMPGEPSIGWWRAEKDNTALRKRLPGMRMIDCEPTTH